MYEFNQLVFPKSGSDIVAKAVQKAEKIEAKITERKRVVGDMAKSLGITNVEDALLRAEDLGLELNAEDQVVHSKMLSNRSKAQKENEELRRLQMLIRNLPPDQSFDLSFDALSYFGF